MNVIAHTGADFALASPGRLHVRRTGRLSSWTRLETAKKLLLFSQKTIAEVSRLSGFTSPQYFSRFFKNRIGMTAEEFRSRNGEMW